MRKWAKILIKVSAIILAVGVVLCGTGYLLRGGKPFGVFFIDGKMVSTDSEDMVFELDKTSVDEFTSIDIKVSNADVEIIPTDGEYAIEYKVAQIEPKFEVEDGMLSVDAVYSSVSVGNVGITTNDYIKVYLPKNTVLNTLKVDSSCGDVTASDVEMNVLDLFMSCGDGKLSGVTVNEVFKVINHSGDINMNASSINETEATMSCGDIILDDVEVLGLTTIDNSCGDIEIRLNNGKCSYDLATSCGSIALNGNDVEGGVEQTATLTTDTKQSIVATNSCGDIILYY